MKGIGKNFIIAFLMILAIYQTAELWFEDFSSHNFFSFSDKADFFKESDVKSHTLKRVIINLGDNRMLSRSNGIYEGTWKKTLDQSVAKILKKGEIVSDGAADWKTILKNRCFVYEYDFVMGSEEIEDVFGVTGGNADRIKSCDTVVISTENGVGRLRFVNSKTMWCLEIKMNDSFNDVNNVFATFSNSSDDLYYISSVQNGFEIFKGNVFIPRWDGQSTGYSYVSAEMQYDDLQDKTALEGEVNLFFENPAGKWSTTVNDVINYSDETTVVKFYPQNVLEYSNYSTEGYGEDNDFYANYMGALSLLEADAGVANEYYLRDWAFSNGEYKLYFGYKINDMEVVMSEELLKKTGMKDYIEVTASYGRVSNYKRYCTSYSVESGKSFVANRDFLTCVDEVYNGFEDAEGLVVDEISLSYVDDGGNEKIALSWLMDIDGKQYVKGAGG